MYQLDNLQNRLDRETDAVDGLSKDNGGLNKDVVDLNGHLHDLEAKVNLGTARCHDHD